MVTKNNVYKKIKTNDYFLIYLNGTELPQTVPEDFIEWVKEVLQSPTSVIVNCFLPEYVPQTWFALFTILNSQLSDSDNKFCFIYVSPKLIESCKHTDFSSFPIQASLREAIKDLHTTSTTKVPTTLMRAFVKSMINTLFIQVNTPIIRQKIYVKRKPQEVETLNGEISGWVLVQTEDFFYYLVISCSERCFLKLVSTMMKDDFTEVTDDITNGLAEIVNIVLGQVKKVLGNDQKIEQKFSYSIPKVHRGKAAPKMNMTFNDRKITSFKGGETIVIPFQTNKGEMFIELWYLKEYEQFLLK
ncbi:MAG: chemotaxis protein CheX [Oligoflexia bacterium]|nr:chemotaxis protein CheX [Oligoflexia bacterium]